METGEDGVVIDRSARICEGGLDEGVIFREEFKLDVVADCGGDVRWSICQTVLANFDDVGYWGARSAAGTWLRSWVGGDSAESG